jgi:PiT family inorganic phosphate transporter
MTTTAFIVLAVAFLAYSNGANDNFKGVATLYGSGTATYDQALRWATVTTFAGSLTSIWFAAELVKAFSGKGLVPDAIVALGTFKFAVALAAALTVIAATRFGFPISTTHALTGALVGAGWVAVGNQVDLSKLGKAFALPLLVSPVLSCLLTFLVARVLPDLPWVDPLNFLASGVVSFARGFNDSPKIAGLLLGVSAIDTPAGITGIALLMALGGWLHAHRVAKTMSTDIAQMDRRQGLIANGVTGALALLASPLGLPVSTTHVTCGAIFGIGLSGKRARWRVMASILTAWVTTLPLAATLGALCYQLQ